MSTPAAPESSPRRISLSNVGDESLSEISIGSERSSYAGIFGKLAAGIIVLVALGGGAAVISAINSPAKESAVPPVKAESPAAPAKADAADATHAAAAADGVNVSVTLAERCWTEVSVDGKSVFEGIIEEGKTESWKGKESVVIRAGNAGALDVTFNGKKLGKFGDNGEVVERRFTKTTKDLKDTLPSASAAGASAADVQEIPSAAAQESVARTERKPPTADPRDAKPARSNTNTR